MGSISLVGGDATVVDTGVTDAVGLRETLSDRLREALSAYREARQQSRQAALGTRTTELDRDVDAPDSVAVIDAGVDVSQTPEFVREAEPTAAGGDADAEDAADTGDTDDNADTDNIAADDADEPAETDDSFIWGESVESEDGDDEDVDDPEESSDKWDAI